MCRTGTRLILSFILAASLVAASCGSPATPSERAAPKETEQPTSMEGTAAIRLTDAAGRTMELDTLPQRIVVLGRGPFMALHLLYMFPEARERLVGMEKKGKSASDFLPLVDPTFDDKIALEGNAGPEQIAALEPDLVIMKSTAVERMSESLEPLDIPLVYLGLETPEQFFQDVTNLGILLGNEARAKEIIDFYRARLDRIREGTEGLHESDKPRVLVLEYSDRGGKVAVQVPAKSWMQTIQVQTVGGTPVWLDAAQITDGWTVANFEQVALWDPDKIFVVVWYTLDPAEVIDSLKADPQWSALTAVKNDRIYAFPSDIYGWDSPEPRWILGMTWLAARIHPDRFEDFDVIQEIYQFFGELYGMDKDAVDADIMPKVRTGVH